MTYRQLTIWSVVIMGALLLSIALGVMALARSERFTVWLLDTLESRAAGRLAVDGVSGTLASELRFARIDFSIGTGALALEDVRVRFDLSGILARAVIIDQLSIGAARLALTSGASERIGSDASAFPLVLVRNAAIQSFAWTSAGASYTLTESRLGLRYVDGSLQVSDLSTIFQDFSIDAAAQIELGTAVVIDADACVRGALDAEPVTGCIEINGEYPDLAFAGQTMAPFPIVASGTLAIGATPTFDVDLRWENAVSSRLPVQSPSGSARLAGTLDRVDIRGRALVVHERRELEITLSAVHEADVIAIESLSALHLQTSLTLSGEVAADFSSATLDLEASHVDPSLIHADWPGDLELRGELRGHAGDSPRAELSNLTIAGDLRGYPIIATGGLEVTAEMLTFRDALIVSRADQVALNGTVAAELDLTAHAEIRDLAAWWPELHGELDADVLIQGGLATPRVSGELGLRNASYRENAIGGLVAAGEAGLGEGDKLDLVVGLTGIRTEQFEVDSVNAEITGTLPAHRVTVAALADQWALAASAAGGYAEEAWRGEIGSLELEPASLESWSLERPSLLALSRTALRLDETCIAHLEARICVALTREGGPDDAVQIAASEFDLDIVAPLLPPDLDFGGMLDATIQIRDLAERPNGRIHAEVRSGVVRAELTPGADIEIPLERLGVDATIESGRVVASSRFETPGFAEGTLDVEIEDVARSDSPLEADVAFVWRDPSALTVLSPDVGDISGTVYVDLGIAGRLDAPTLSGEARFENGTVEVPVWGLVIEQINGRAMAARADRVAFSARGSIDGAELRIEGETELAAGAGFPTTLRLQGDAVQLVQIPDAEVIVSPDLTADIALPNVAVSGRVEIPRARIAAVGLPEQAAIPSRDSIVHGREAQTPDRPLAVSAELTISLGDDVRYQDANIDAAVSGDVAVTYESERGATAVGTLILTGRYDAYGNELELENGRLIFAGPWNNPAVDVRAVRRIDETTVGVQLTGTLNSPQTRIFSDPAMSETNALSYLLFGRPLEEASDTEALEDAAIAMGLQQALPIDLIGETLGLDELAIGGTSTDTSALMAGKYLSPNLYLRYSYGLFNRIGDLLLRYRISERLSLETQSGERKSADLFYTVEKE